MNIRSASTKDGFTILELIIVIAIIAVLASAGLGIAYRMIEKAKRTAASAVCTDLSEAIKTFQIDHSGDFPIDVSEDVVISSNSPQGIAILRVLLDEEPGGSSVNQRGRDYLNVKLGDNDKDGLIRNSSGDVIGLYDPWGGDYKIMLDGDRDDTLDILPKGASSAKRLKLSVGVWTDGRDGVDATGESKDDVTSW